MDQNKILEYAKIFGEPKDPRKPYTMLQTVVCETGTANPEDYTYVFDVLLETDKIYVVTSTGEITQENVTPDSPASVTFIDVSSPNYYVKFTDYLSKKEDVFARKTKTINRAMNAYENYLIINAIDGAVQTANEFSLSSGKTTFTYENLIDMMDSIQDYGDKFVLIAGTSIAKDIVLWDWTENKYHSLKEALADLNIEIIRVNQTVTVGGSATSVLASNKAYLVATDTEVGKPVLFIRKKLDTVKSLGGVFSENGEVPERIVITTGVPTTVFSGSKHYFAVGIVGFQECVVAVVNPYALASFSRS